jgi:hypothetical protein
LPDDVLDAQDEDRVWIFQCERETTLGPKKVEAIIADFFSHTPATPHGYVLAAACHFSKAARDTFAQALRAHGVLEFYLWGKGELEDQLLQPKNDHLLFAYFGISLQVRRTSVRSQIRHRLALKRKLVKELGDIRSRGYKSVLIRDPSDNSYPFVDDPESFRKRPPWRYWEFYSHEPPDHVTFVTKRFYAYGNYETKEWDYLKGSDIGIPSNPEIAFSQHLGTRHSDRDQINDAYSQLHIDADKRCWLLELGHIHYDRILAYDEVGDSYNEGPHLLVDYRGQDPFEDAFRAVILPSDGYAMWELFPKGPEDPKRIKIFPDDIPDEREEYIS